MYTCRLETNGDASMANVSFELSERTNGSRSEKRNELMSIIFFVSLRQAIGKNDYSFYFLRTAGGNKASVL